MNILIDGKECSCEQGEILLHVAKRNGIYIPSLCYHEGLGSVGSCRVCIVEVVQNGRSKVVISCAYLVEEGIEVFSNSDKIKKERGVIFTLLTRLAPDARVIREIAEFSGVDLPRLAPKAEGGTCVLCGRCTLACSLTGTGAIAKMDRGTEKRMDTPYGEPTEECIGCTSCARVCPTDSIHYEETATQVSIWGRTFDLKRCEICGKPISTGEQVALVQQRTEGDATVLCRKCRQTEAVIKASSATL